MSVYERKWMRREGYLEKREREKERERGGGGGEREGGDVGQNFKWPISNKWFAIQFDSSLPIQGKMKKKLSQNFKIRRNWGLRCFFTWFLTFLLFIYIWLPKKILTGRTSCQCHLQCILINHKMSNWWTKLLIYSILKRHEDRTTIFVSTKVPPFIIKLMKNCDIISLHRKNT